MKRYLVDALLVVCALVVTGLVVHRQFFGGQVEAPVALALGVPSDVQMDDISRRDGAIDPAIVVVVFTDYECGFCSRLESSWDSVLSGPHAGRIARVVRHLPLNQNHVYSRQAAAKAECTRAQGLFPQVHREFLARWRNLTPEVMTAVLDSIRIPDLVKFERCVAAESTQSTIDADIALARALGLAGTPVTVIGDSALLGAVSAADLNDRIQKVLSANR